MPVVVGMSPCMMTVTPGWSAKIRVHQPRRLVGGLDAPAYWLEVVDPADVQQHHVQLAAASHPSTLSLIWSTV